MTSSACRSLSTLACLAGCLLAAAACEDQPQTRVRRRADGAAPPVASAPAAAATVEVRPKIVSVTPSTVAITDGRARNGSYEVVYEIPNASRVTKAELHVYARGVGELRHLDVPADEHGSARFDLNAQAVDFGPTVRFRAHCQAGVTDWYTLGSQPLSDDERIARTFRIASVMPESVALDRAAVANAGDAPDGVPISVWGPLLGPACTVETTVNGKAVTLNNPHAESKGIQGLLLYKDLGNRPVSSRFLEFQLRVTGQGFRREQVAYVMFVE